LKSLLLMTAISLMAANAWADQTTCTSQAMDKKLAGAAKTSFMKKCQADALAACTATASDKKLAGAAKTSFMKKCQADAGG
jgi:psiF repeat